MADKRMFSNKVIDSDAFLDMPLSAQALYFHLNLRADDDGFVNNAKRIQRSINASTDDLNLLIAKRFLLTFPSGIVVVKHWCMHNSLRKDRYKPTQYLDERASLYIKSNNAYTERPVGVLVDSMATKTLPPVCVIEDSVGEASVAQGEKSESQFSADEESIAAVTAAYRELCPMLPQTAATSKTLELIIHRLKVDGLNDIIAALGMVSHSDFLQGLTDPPLSCSLEWILADKNFYKVRKGSYSTYKSSAGKNTDTSQDYSYGEEERAAIKRLQAMREVGRKLSEA